MTTPVDAPYKLAQRERAKSRLLATSKELSDYQREHGISAVRMAKLAKAKLANQNSEPL